MEEKKTNKGKTRFSNAGLLNDVCEIETDSSESVKYFIARLIYVRIKLIL